MDSSTLSQTTPKLRRSIRTLGQTNKTNCSGTNKTIDHHCSKRGPYPAYPETISNDKRRSVKPSISGSKSKWSNNENNHNQDKSSTSEEDEDEEDSESLQPPQKLFTKCYECGIYTADAKKHEETHLPVYKCQICGIGFARKIKLNNHYKLEHPKNIPVKCYYCWEQFETASLLTEHIKAAHRRINNKFECKVCGKPCQDNHAVSIHQLVHTKEKPHKCEECNRSYVLESSLKIHMKSHSKSTLKCNECNKEFTRKDKLRAHLQTHYEDIKGNWVLCPHVKPTYRTSNNNFPVFCKSCDGAAVCAFCGFGFQNKKMYMAHSHNNLCTKCGIKFFEGKFYEQHERYHQKNIRFKCEVCKYGFDTLVSYSLHKSKQHLIRLRKTKKLFQCSLCGKDLSTKQNLNFHMKSTHEDDRPFKCGKCNARFVTQTLLNIHSRKHKAYKKFQCNICDKRFTRKTDLNRHSKSHSDERPFECKICGVSVKSKRNLKLHMDTHTEKPYECGTCHKFFRQKCYLKVHMKIHENSKPFKCEKCGKSFLKEQGLEEHLPTHIGTSKFYCENCDQYFCSAFSLRKHTALRFCFDEDD